MTHFAKHYEENYLKALFKLSHKELKKVNNIALAKYMELNPATVLEMVRKMAERDLVQILPDKSIRLTKTGEQQALLIIRKHRLWEVFLVEKLAFKWNEVHDLAEQLEHIDSNELVDRLEEFLGHPEADPHGDPIPDRSGNLKKRPAFPLLEGKIGTSYIISSFADTADAFLDYLGKLHLLPGTRIRLSDLQEYDHSCIIHSGSQEIQLSEKASRNILVQPV